MSPTAADYAIALAIAALAALGGAAMVFSEFDDAPGGVLMGLLLILGSVVLGGRLLARGR